MINKLQFAAVDLKSVIEAVQSCSEQYPDLDSVQTAFGKNADRDSNQSAASKFVAVICRLKIKTEDPHAPLEPAFRTKTMSSPSLDDITNDQASMLREVLPMVTIRELRARFGDIAWLKLRDHRCAAMAAEAYTNTAVAIVATGGVLEVRERFERALQIGSLLGRNRDLYRNTLAAIERVALDPAQKNCVVADSVRLLLRFGGERLNEYANAVESRATERIGDVKNRIWTRNFWELAAGCYSKLNDADAARRARLEVAKSFEAEADEVLGSDRYAKSMIAAHFLEQALHVDRQVSGTDDDRRRVHLRVIECKQKGQTELIRVSCGETNIADFVNHSRSRVKGREKRGALATLVFASHWMEKSTVERGATDSVRQGVLSSMFPMTQMSSTAKSTAHAPGCTPGDDSIPANLLLSRMCEEYRHFFPITVCGQIEPIREQLIFDHQIDWSELIEFVAYSPFVPTGREGLFIDGLLHGIRGRFVESLSILVPQVEHALRCILHQQAVVTSSLDDEGIEQEFDLNRLLRMPELEQVLGCDLVFVLRVLLIERFGSNFRNEMAHGMLAGQAFFQPAAIYLWWLILHLVAAPTASTILSAENGGAAEHNER